VFIIESVIGNLVSLTGAFKRVAPFMVSGIVVVPLAILFHGIIMAIPMMMR